MDRHPPSHRHSSMSSSHMDTADNNNQSYNLERLSLGRGVKRKCVDDHRNDEEDCDFELSPAEQLPNELLIKIFKHLNCQDLQSASRVSKQWQSNAQELYEEFRKVRKYLIKTITLSPFTTSILFDSDRQHESFNTWTFHESCDKRDFLRKSGFPV